ncbi:hypothetical protein L6452_08465 [Arctium lappa]|uniref:Uncharacterized protein n=1 Tax=Arctium lappa TaxID=4217 RepID=A0ACB9DHL0_ARCLA|nr:hypothetical protein L6452_08465 [Arctium lappa]
MRYHGADLVLIVGIGGLGIIISNYNQDIVMSAAVARGHGGDVGLILLLIQIEYLQSARQQHQNGKKKNRGMSRSKNLDIAFEANGNKPLPIEFDLIEDTYKPVGSYASKLTRYLGNLIGYSASPHHRSWNEVYPEFKTSIIRRLRRFFFLDPIVPEWPKILAGIERDCQDQKPGNTLQSSIDNWHDMHYRPSGGWVNELPKKDYEQMLAERASQTQQDGSTSSSFVNEKEIITKVLGGMSRSQPRD